MIRIVTTRAWRELHEQLESQKARGDFLEKKGLEFAEKAKALADTLGKVASWLAANILAAGRSHRTLSSRDVAKAVGFDLSVEPQKDGGILLKVVPKPPKGKPLDEVDKAIVTAKPADKVNEKF